MTTFSMEPSPSKVEAILAQDAIEPMAIIGMAVRYPGDASTVSGFWDMISRGRTAHSEVPRDRWNVDTWYHPNPDRKGTVGFPIFLFTLSGYFPGLRSRGVLMIWTPDQRQEGLLS